MSKKIKDKRKRIVALIGTGVMTLSSTGLSVATVIKENSLEKGDNMLSQEVKDALKHKADSAYLIALLNNLNQYLQNPNDQATIVIVRSNLETLKQQLQLEINKVNIK